VAGFLRSLGSAFEATSRYMLAFEMTESATPSFRRSADTLRYRAVVSQLRNPAYSHIQCAGFLRSLGSVLETTSWYMLAFEMTESAGGFGRIHSTRTRQPVISKERGHLTTWSRCLATEKSVLLAHPMRQISPLARKRVRNHKLVYARVRNDGVR
jgi:hypothetical protein